MNTQVTAKGMNVKAKAEGGIVISNQNTGGTWSDSADATYSSVIALYPTSTADTSHWYHAKSTNAADAQAGQTAEGAYTELSTISLSNDPVGVGYTEVSGDGFQADTDNCYYLLSKFFIKSSGEPISVASGTALYINTVTVAATQGSSAHDKQAIDASLRVAIVVGSTTYIYAPVTSVSVGENTYNATFTYKVANGASNTVAYNPTEETAGGTGSGAYRGGKNCATSITTIGNTDATEIPVSIYVFFEGEDANCKSDNVSGIVMNNLEVSVVFGTTTIS